MESSRQSTQPVCVYCWYPYSVGSRGFMSHPDRAQTAAEEKCAICGNPTRDGIYIRVDPDGVPFPTKANGN